MRTTTHPGLDGEPIHRDYDATASRHLTRMLLNTMVGLRLPARAGDGPDRLHRVIDATIDSL